MTIWSVGKLFVGVSILVVATPALAVVPNTYTIDNFYTSYQDAPASFGQDIFGNWSGFTASGKLFSQRAVVSDIHVRLHCFTIDQASFYVSNFGTFEASSDTVALSVYLAQAGYEEAV